MKNYEVGAKYNDLTRCIDCKYGSKQGGYASIEEADTHVNCQIKLTSGFHSLVMPDDGFCSDGEPKAPKE